VAVSKKWKCSDGKTYSFTRINGVSRDDGGGFGAIQPEQPQRQDKEKDTRGAYGEDALLK